MTSVCMGPFRIAEGEQEPENCWPNEADGWRVWVNPYGRTYYYRNKVGAERAVAALQTGERVRGGKPWWPRATVYLA